MKTQFTTLVDSYKTNLLEQDELPPGGEDMPPDPDEMPPAAPPPVPEVEASPGPQAIEDLTIAGKIALQIDDLTPEDRSMLIQPVNGENIDNVRDLLTTIAGKYDVPD